MTIKLRPKDYYHGRVLYAVYTYPWAEAKPNLCRFVLAGRLQQLADWLRQHQARFSDPDGLTDYILRRFIRRHGWVRGWKRPDLPGVLVSSIEVFSEYSGKFEKSNTAPNVLSRRNSDGSWDFEGLQFLRVGEGSFPGGHFRKLKAAMRHYRSVRP